MKKQNLTKFFLTWVVLLFMNFSWLKANDITQEFIEENPAITLIGDAKIHFVSDEETLADISVQKSSPKKTIKKEQKGVIQHKKSYQYFSLKSNLHKLKNSSSSHELSFKNTKNTYCLSSFQKDIHIVNWKELFIASEINDRLLILYAFPHHDTEAYHLLPSRAPPSLA